MSTFKKKSVQSVDLNKCANNNNEMITKSRISHTCYQSMTPQSNRQFKYIDIRLVMTMVSIDKRKLDLTIDHTCSLINYPDG